MPQKTTSVQKNTVPATVQARASAISPKLTDESYTEAKAELYRLDDLRRSGIDTTTDVAMQRLYENCYYPDRLSFQQYYDMYSRNNVAARVIETFPNYTWGASPIVKDAGGSDSKFSKAVAELLKQEFKWKDNIKQTLLSAFKQLDVLGGIGGEALLVFGFKDGKTLDQPVEHKKNMELEYIKVLHNGQFRIEEVEDDDESPNYADVKTYITKSFTTSKEINFVDTIASNKIIHSSRTVHFKETAGLAYGTSRIQKCYNQLLDIVKVSGASAEVYWLGAFSGLLVSTDPTATLSDEGRTAMEEGIKEYFSGLARALLLEGSQGKLLYPAIVSPKEHYDLQITMVSIATEIPRRFLTGAEAAKLASQQDSLNWMDRVGNRRNNFVSPNVVSPAIQRLIDAGVLPKPNKNIVTVTWPKTQSLALNDRSTAALEMTEAVALYFTSGVSKAMSFVAYLVSVCGYGEEEAIALDEKTDLSKYEPPVATTLTTSTATKSTSTADTKKTNAAIKAVKDNLEQQISDVGNRTDALDNKLAFIAKEIE